MAAGDDTTPPDPLSFNNVPRRPRSAVSLPPLKEEPDGGDDHGGISSVSNNASLPAMASVVSKKRPGGAGAQHGTRAKKHRLLVPIEELKPEDAKDRGVGFTSPALLSHKDKAAAAAAAAAASSSEALPVVDWAENERWRKGKMPVVKEDDYAYAAVARPRPAGSGGHGNGKLLGDAIRSHESATAVAGSLKPPASSRTTKAEKPRTKPKKPRKERNRRIPTKKEKPTRDSSARFWCGCGMGRDGMSSAGSDADYSFDRIGVVSDRLRTTLRGLGVAAPGPVRLYGRLLTRCDRLTMQARLLMSCKRWRAEGVEFPPCAFMTEEEKEAAYGDGLLLTAYDRGGDAYEIKFRFLDSNEACRLINKWTDFLRDNGLVVGAGEPAPVNDEVMLDLWFFRTSRGKIGMVMLHYRRGDAPHADAALDEVDRKRLHQLMRNNNAAAADAVMEDAVGEANEEDAGVMVEVAAAAADAVMEDAVGDANDEDAGVMVEVAAAAAPAPSSPSEPSGGGAIEAAATTSSPSEPDGANGAEEHAGALADDAPSTSSEVHGGAGRSDEVTAPLLPLGGGGGTETGGALMVMVLEVEAATQSAIVVAGPPSSPEQAGGGAAMMSTEDEDEAAAEVVEAAARSWNVTKYEFQAAQGLMMLSESEAESNS